MITLKVYFLTQSNEPPGCSGTGFIIIFIIRQTTNQNIKNKFDYSWNNSVSVIILLVKWLVDLLNNFFNLFIEDTKKSV